MLRVVLAALVGAALASPANAASGDLTCAQYLRNFASQPPEDQNEARVRAYCKKHPKTGITAAREKVLGY